MARAYISGPITGCKKTARERFGDAEKFLSEGGYHVFNPERALRNTGFKYHEYMDICLKMLERCHVLILIDGWRQSTGACIEAGYALGLGDINLFELIGGRLMEFSLRRESEV